MSEIETSALSSLLCIIPSYFAETSMTANFQLEILEIVMPQKKCLKSFRSCVKGRTWGYPYYFIFIQNGANETLLLKWLLKYIYEEKEKK
jgi:hypothetical protein